MIGRIITRGRNNGLKYLSSGSPPPFPLPFLTIFPQTEARLLIADEDEQFFFSDQMGRADVSRLQQPGY